MNLKVVFSVLVICLSVELVSGWIVGLGGIGGLGQGGVGLGGIGGIGLGGVGLGIGGVGLGGVGLGGLGMAGLGVGLPGLGIAGLGIGGITGCRCTAIQANNPNVVVRDFGIIQACGALSLCGCNEAGVRSCRRACERVVDVWADTACPAVLRDTQVQAAFQTTLCAVGLGQAITGCDGNGL